MLQQSTLDPVKWNKAAKREQPPAITSLEHEQAFFLGKTPTKGEKGKSETPLHVEDHLRIENMRNGRRELPRNTKHHRYIKFRQDPPR